MWNSNRFFEHPLTAATSAMLNISGANNSSNNDDESGATTASVTAATATNVSIGALGTPHQVHQVHNPNGSTSFVYEYYKVPDKDNIQWAWVYIFYYFCIVKRTKRCSFLFYTCIFNFSPSSTNSIFFTINNIFIWRNFVYLICCYIIFFNRILHSFWYLVFTTFHNWMMRECSVECACTSDTYSRLNFLILCYFVCILCCVKRCTEK